jgi:hypothetical protein
MKSLNHLHGLSIAVAILLSISACDQNANQKTLGGSQDTSNINRAGGPPISDTATLNKNARDSAATPAGDSTSKGNAAPSGHNN